VSTFPFALHPSKRLQTAFRTKYFQGRDPASASVVLLGSDANYSPALSEHPFFEYVIAYHEDGPGFFMANGVHHPFLLPEYPFDKRTGGVPYHRNIAATFDGSLLGDLAFVELLDVPTTGVKSSSAASRATYSSLLSEDHLMRLDRLIDSSAGKLILVPTGVLEQMSALNLRLRVFKWVPEIFKRDYLVLPNGSCIHRIYHPSSSYFFRGLEGLRAKVRDWIGTGLNRKTPCQNSTSVAGS
jgi:hypothetical protein